MSVMPNVASFIAFILVSAYTPGPNNIMSMNNAATVGLRKALPLNAGIFTGFVMVMQACAFTGARLYDVFPAVRIALTLFGAAYILFLAGKTIRTKQNGDCPSHGQTFIAGLLLQFVNPKIILYGLTALGSFVLPYYREPFTIAAFALLLAAVGSSANICWAVFGNLFKRIMANHQRLVSYTLVAALLYCAVTVITTMFK